MRDFSYLRAGSAEEARREAGASGALFLAGGTTLLDLAKCGVAAPAKLVDITYLKGLDAIRVTAEGAFIGALAKMSRVAEDAGIKAQFPAVAEALWQAASAQIRPKPFEQPVMNQTFESAIRPPAEMCRCVSRASYPLPPKCCSRSASVIRRSGSLTSVTTRMRRPRCHG